LILSLWHDNIAVFGNDFETKLNTSAAQLHATPSLHEITGIGNYFSTEAAPRRSVHRKKYFL